MIAIEQQMREINPDEHAHLLLGYFGESISDLGPRAATMLLHLKIATSSNNQLEEVAEKAALFFARNGRVELREVNELTRNCVNELEMIRSRELNSK